MNMVRHYEYGINNAFGAIHILLSTGPFQLDIQYVVATPVIEQSTGIPG